MAFRKKYLNEILGTVLVLSGLLSTASAVDCYGKSFHCVNSTHFMICVDLGGGVSQSIDNFLIACPPPTVCQGNNHFECELPAVTTPSTTLSNVIIETTQPWEEIVVTTNSPQKNTTKEYSEKYLNTVCLTTLPEDSFTTDATVDITTEVSTSNVNNNLLTAETVPASVINDMSTGLNVITQTIPDNIVTHTADATTEKGQVMPLNENRNVTNETLLNEIINDNITSSPTVTEPTITTMLTNSVAPNANINMTSEIKNGTVTSETGNSTRKNEFDLTTPDTLILDSSIGTEQPLTITTDKIITTGANLEGQSVVSTDALENTVNTNVQATSTEPAMVHDSFGTEQPYKHVLGKNITSEVGPNFATKQSTNSTTDAMDQLPIMTVTEYTVTSKNAIDEITQLNGRVTVETSVGSEQTTTNIYEENFSIVGNDDIYTGEEPQNFATNGKEDTQNSNVLDQVSTKLTDDRIIYLGTEQPTTNKNSLLTDTDVTTEKLIVFTTETQKLSGIGQPTTNKHGLATDNDTITEKSSVFTTEIKKLPGTEQPTTNYVRLTENDTITEKSRAFTAEKETLIYMSSKQPQTNRNNLPTDIDVTTENISVFTTETQKLQGTEQLTTNKNSLATKNDTLTEKSSLFTTQTNGNSLLTDIDVKAEKTSVFTTETQNLLSTKQPTTNKNSLATENGTLTEQSSVFTTETQNSIYMSSEQPTPNENILSTDIDVTTEKTSDFTTETQKLLGTEQPSTNKNSLPTDIDMKTEKTSVFTTETTEILKLMGNAQPTINKNSLATENDTLTEQSSVFTTETQNSIYMSSAQSTPNENILSSDIDVTTEKTSDFTMKTQKLLGTEPPTTNKNSLATENDTLTEQSSVFTTETQNSIYISSAQSTPNENILSSDIDVTTEKTSDFTMETQKLLGTEPPTTNINSLATENDTLTEKSSIFTTEIQKSIYMSSEQPTPNKNILPTDIDVTTEKTSVYITDTPKVLGTEQPTINKNSLQTENDTITEKSSVFTTQTQKSIYMSSGQSTSNENIMQTRIDVTTEKRSVFTTEEQKLQGTEQLTTNKNSLATKNDTLTEKSSVFTTEIPKLIYMSSEQTQTNKNSFPTDVDVATEKTGVFTTDTQKLLGNEQLITTKYILATDNDAITEKVSDFTKETPKPTHMESDTLTTNENSSPTYVDVTTEKTNVFTTETRNMIHMRTEQQSINKNSSATGTETTTATSESTTEAQKSIYTSSERLTSGKKSLVTENDAITDKPIVFIMQTVKSIYIDPERPTTIKNSLVTDADGKPAETSVFTTVTQEPIDVSTKQPTTNKYGLATDIALTTEKASVSTIDNPTIQIKEEVAAFTDASLSEQIVITVQQLQESSPTTVNLITDKSTIHFNDTENFTNKKDLHLDAITTDGVIGHNTDFTERPKTTTFEDNTGTDATIFTDKGTASIIITYQNDTTPKNETSVTEIVQSIITTTELTAENFAENSHINLDSKMTKELTKDFTSNTQTSDSNIANLTPLDNVKIVTKIIAEQPNQNIFEGKASPIDSLMSTTKRSVYENNETEYRTSTSETTLTLSYGLKDTTLSTNTNTTESATGVTANISPTTSDVPVIDSAGSIDTNTKVATISASKITIANDSNQNTVKPTMSDSLNVIENIVKNEQTTESNLKVIRPILSKQETATYNNIDDIESGITNANSISDHVLNTDIVNSKVTTTERVKGIQVEDIEVQGAKQLPTTITDDMGTISTWNVNLVNDLLDSSLHKKINYETKKSDSAYSGQFPGDEVTSETTTRENYTPSLNATGERSHQTKSVTPSHQESAENANTVKGNLADSSSALTVTNNTIFKVVDDDLNVLPTNNGNIDNTLTSLNIQENSYASLATTKSISFDNNVANNQDPKLFTISETVKQNHETTQVSPQIDDFKPSPVQIDNHEVDDIPTIKGIFEDTGTSFTEKSTSISGIDFESHISNKNGIIEHVETTAQTIKNREIMSTVAPIKNSNGNNLLPNPLLNTLLDKINQAGRPLNEASVSFSSKSDGNINSMSTSPTSTFLVTDDSSAHYNVVPFLENSNEITTQSLIPSVPTNDYLPTARYDSDSLSIPDNLQKTRETASTTETEKLPDIHTTTLKNTAVPKEEMLTNAANDIASSAEPMTYSTTEFSVVVGIQNVYKTIGAYFTPSEASSQENSNIKVNSDIPSIQTSNGILDSSKTSSNIPTTESLLIGNTEKINSLISKLGPNSAAINLSPSVTYKTISSTGVNTNDYPKTTTLEISTETNTNYEEGNTILKKPATLEALPLPHYKIRINTANINEPLPSALYGIETSETKTSKEPYNSVTSQPGKVTPSIINSYKYGKQVTSDTVTGTSSHAASIPTEKTYSVVTPSSQQEVVNTAETDAKSLPGNYNLPVTQNNNQNVSASNISINNSSLSASKIYAGSNAPIVAEFTNVSLNATNKHSYSNPQTYSANTTRQDAANRITNSSIASRNTYQGRNSTIISKNELQSTQMNENASSLFQNSTNNTKPNIQGDLKPQQKTSTNSTRHVAGQSKPTKTPENKIIHSVTITTRAPTTRVTPRPISPTTNNPNKQISKTAVVNYTCINGIRGRYSDKDDCRKFYICIGNSQPIVGNCPANTVFSDISKMCTKNLSHCIRENEFKCPSEGRFSDVIKDNVYYICVNYQMHLYRFKFQCQKGFTLNKTSLRCIENKEIESNESVSISISENGGNGSSGSVTSSSSTSISTTISGSSSINSGNDSSSSSSSSKDTTSNGDSGNNSDSSTSKSKRSKEKKESKEKPEGKEGDDDEEVFECKKQGKFPVRNDCRRYYLCKKNGKSEYRRKIKKCDSGDVFHKSKKKSKNSSSSGSGSNSDRRSSKSRKNRETEEERESKEGDEKKERKEIAEGKEGQREHEVFKCEKEGKFPVPDDCRRYYLCKRSRKSEYRRKVKKCESGDVFHEGRKKCVDADSYEC